MAELKGEARRQHVAELFSRIAGSYDLMNTLMTAGMHFRWRRITAAKATEGVAEGMALDVATGTGDMAFALAKATNIRKVVGLDLISEMTSRACLKAHTRDPLKKVEFVMGDALHLPFPDSSFACVTSAFGLRNMPDLRRALEEMARVIRPGGRLATLEIMPLSDGPFHHLFHLYFHHVVPLAGRLIAGDRAAYTYLPQSVDAFLSVEALAVLFRELGLIDVGHRRLGLGSVAVHWGTKPTVLPSTR